MDTNWSEMNKEMQALIAKKATFKDGVWTQVKQPMHLFKESGMTAPAGVGYCLAVRKG